MGAELDLGLPMMKDHHRTKTLLLLSALGAAVSILAGLEGRVGWLADLCGYMGDGCRETLTYDLLGIAVWIWGIAFYGALAVAIRFHEPSVSWLAMIGLGAEINLAWIMAGQQLICVFCIANAVVVALLFFFSFKKQLFWQTVAIVIMALNTSHLLMAPAQEAIPQPATRPADVSVVARVGSQTITTTELESPLSTKIYKLQQEIYELKRERLDGLIDGLLLRQAAEQKGLTVQQYIDVQTSSGAAVTDGEVEDFYRRNLSRWSNWNGTQEELRNRIRLYLQSQKDLDNLKTIAKPLREQFPVIVYLKEPPLPLSSVSIGNAPALGPSDAAVTIVEFSDYLCPACRAAHSTTRKIREAFAGKIRWVFKDYPLDRHPGARKLAEAAHCADEQGSFWQFQDLLFDAAETPDSVQLSQFAHELGLDADRFMQCYESGKNADKVSQNIEDARAGGVSSTPTFVINGKLKPGSLPFDDFADIIKDELHKAGVKDDAP
jgi:protein-disulfide isomerase